MLIKATTNELATIVEKLKTEVSPNDRDEMAIPTYLHKNPLIKWLFWKRHEKIIALAELDGKKSVLDFGCGIGILLPTLSKYSQKVFATDIFPQFAKQLSTEKKLNITFFQSENMDKEIIDKEIDIIIAADVMEHLDKPGIEASLFFKKIKQGGSLIISGPTENILYATGRMIAGFGDKGGYHHFNVYDLDKIIQENGFKKEKEIKIPFSFLPALFKIILYKKPQ
jgi:2-polyprenyl-3-methyl-5-hydroxy-6-metoxy-1,4-benzoquinol methylase